MNSESIDLHGMTVEEAIIELSNFLDGLGRDVDEVTVIHGYKGGAAIKNMLRLEFRHKRVARKIYSLNQGITILQLKH